MIDLPLPVIGLDTDIHTPDVASLGPAVTVTDLATEGARQLFETAVHQTTDVVVNLPPAVHTRLARWLGEVERWPVLTKHPVELIKWFVVSGEYDSATSLQASLETFGGKIPHVIVRNQKYPDWSFFDAFTAVQDLIGEMHSPVIDLPKLPADVANTLLQERLSFAAAHTPPSVRLGHLEQATVNRYLKTAYAAMESTGYLPTGS